MKLTPKREVAGCKDIEIHYKMRSNRKLDAKKRIGAGFSGKPEDWS